MELYIFGTGQDEISGEWVRLPAIEVKIPAGALTVFLLDNSGHRFEGIAEKTDRSRLPALNHMALILRSLSEDEQATLDAMLECENSISIRMVERLLSLLPQATLFVGATDDEALGRYHMEHKLHIVLPRQIAAHFDYQGYGAAVRKSNPGIFTSTGFLMYGL